MPVFNEQASIQQVVRSWFAMLEKTVGDFVLLAINDGSTDQTQSLLAGLATELGPRIELIHRSNRGHGQTCLQGYRIAMRRCIPRVLQIDSDGQSDPAHFPQFWELRDRFDVLYGRRNRQDGLRRVVASQVLRFVLRRRAGVDCVDANVPYRLMDTRACSQAIEAIPAEFDLANIALAVALRKSPAVRHGEVPIGFPPRLGGEPSVPFLKFAVKAFELVRQLDASGLSGAPAKTVIPVPSPDPKS